MRPDLALADRRRAVREAARDWCAAGIIDAESERQIASLYPDDRVRMTGAMRALLGFFSFLAGAALLLFVMASNRHGWLPALAVAAALMLVTELLVARRRRDQGGVEEGTASAALLAACTAAALSAEHLVTAPSGHVVFRLATSVGAAFCLLAVRRWAMPVLGLVGALLSCLLIGTLQNQRLWLILTVAAAAPLLHRAAGSRHLTPSERLAADCALAVALAAVYLSVNVYSFDEHWLELGRAGVGEAPFAAGTRPAFVAATILLPLVVLTVGILSRRRVWLLGGTAMTIASLVTIRAYYHLAPAWLLLVLAGLALATVVMALRWFLESGRQRERGGFTSDPLDGRSRSAPLIETAAALATFTPEAAARSAEKGLPPGGGQFGGGGASDGF